MRHTRRAFLSRSLAGVAGAGLLTGCGREDAAEGRAGVVRPASTLMPAANAAPGPTIVRVSCADVFTEDGLDAEAVAGMVRLGLSELSRDQRPILEWLVTPEDIVAMKVNCLAGPPLSTHPEVAAGLAQCLAEAGVDPDNLLIYDRDTAELKAVGFDSTATPLGANVVGTDHVGYDREPTVVRSVGTCFSRIVSEVATAIVNIPVLKDHDVAGISGAMKNHYGSIHNPNKLHMDHCSPYVADLNCADAIRSRERLIVMDALLACYDGGPSYKPATTLQFGQLWFCMDPLAIDVVAQEAIEDLRRDAGLPTLAEEDRQPVYIAEASKDDRAIGCGDRDAIVVVDTEYAKG